MGDDALRIFGNINKYKGAVKLAAAQAVLITSYLGAQNLLDEDPEDGKTALEKTPEEAKNIIAKNAVEVTREGGSFDKAFTAAFNEGLSSFEFEGDIYKVALATDDPDVQLVPQRKEPLVSNLKDLRDEPIGNFQEFDSIETELRDKGIISPSVGDILREEGETETFLKI